MDTHLTKECWDLKRRRKVFCYKCGGEGHKKAYCMRRPAMSGVNMYRHSAATRSSRFEPRGGYREFPRAPPVPPLLARSVHAPPFVPRSSFAATMPLSRGPVHSNCHIPLTGMWNTGSGRGSVLGRYVASNVNVPNNRRIDINDLNDLGQFPPLSTLV
jgi:hypothetical protein